MARTFRFPIPREERILVLTAVICVPALIGVVLLMLGNVAAASDMTLWQLFDGSRELRAAFAGMLVLYVAGLYGAWAFVRVKDGSRLEVGETIRFVRPGAPITGWWAADVSFAASDVDALALERVRRVTVERVEARLSAGRDEVAVNLGHAVEGDSEPARSARANLPRDRWSAEPLVEALRDATGNEAVLY